jgi:DNA replication and repair protein RecF
LLPELGSLDLCYRSGWSENRDFLTTLRNNRGKDMARGHTTAGPHRGDWSIAFENAPFREHLSRGQEKLTALGCMLAQAELHADIRGEWPIVCLDDLASELDQAHQSAVVAQLMAVGAQVLLTGTEIPQALDAISATVFHVEQGTVTPLL